MWLDSSSSNGDIAALKVREQLKLNGFGLAFKADAPWVGTNADFRSAPDYRVPVMRVPCNRVARMPTRHRESAGRL